MEWIISVWVLGAAFWYGWHRGARAEEGWDIKEQDAVWLVWPAYRLGYMCGEKHMARKLAPERMKAKLMQEQMLKPMPTPWYANIIQSTSTSPTWIGGTISGTTNTP